MEDEVIPEDNRAYSTREYWESRYKRDSVPYDWFKEWADLKPFLSCYLRSNYRILMLGCGSSLLSEQMYLDSYEYITNVDFSNQVIEMMRKRCHRLSNMSWLEMDVMNLVGLSDCSFDIAIDKGTMDALLCDQTSVWDVDDHVAQNIVKMLSEVSRVLRPEGVFIYITFGQPHFRRKLLERESYDWEIINITTLGDFFHYFIYFMRKRCSHAPEHKE
jgi:ubiquinone/menaquinone biosynthesis C-methylase UbiE